MKIALVTSLLLSVISGCSYHPHGSIPSFVSASTKQLHDLPAPVREAAKANGVSDVNFLGAIFIVSPRRINNDLWRRYNTVFEMVESHYACEIYRKDSKNMILYRYNPLAVFVLKEGDEYELKTDFRISKIKAGDWREVVIESEK
jgi:hypothetical protein